MIRNTPLLLVFTALLAAGCQSGDDGSVEASAPPEETALAPPVSALPAERTAVQAPAALAPALSFSRSGGFAGFDERLDIAEDGTLTLTRRGRVVTRRAMPRETLGGLTTALDDCELFDQDRTYTGRGADLITYEISYNGRNIVAQDGAVPEALQPVLQELQTLLQTPDGG